MKKAVWLVILLVFSFEATVQCKAGQAPAAGSVAGSYQPKSDHDKARSEAEFTALAYMRTVAYAEKSYYRRHSKYAPSLQDLVGTGSFTRRMANPQRGDYAVHYHAKAEGFGLTLTPSQPDASHRSFFVDETGEFRTEEAGPATDSSPRLE
ncbi:MAG: hypothetical protein ABSD20_00775 [Terriglobales bacterium]